jgi:hypothetical protein
VNEVTAYVAPGEFATLQHEPGHNAMELGGFVTVTMLARGELVKAARCLGDNVVAELKFDPGCRC